MASTKDEKATAFRAWVDASVACQYAAAELNDLVEGTDEYICAQAALDQRCAAMRVAHGQWRKVCGADR